MIYYRPLLLSFLCLFCFSLVHAQLPSSNANINGNSQVWVLPDDLSDKNKGKTETVNINFFEYPYQNERIDLRDLKKRYPRLVAPDFTTIKAPDLAGFGKLGILMGLIEDAKPDFNAVVIWLTATNEEGEVTFFLDGNLDRNFVKDLEIVKLDHRDAPRKVTIRPKRGDIPTQELFIKVPKPVEEEKIKTAVAKPKAKIVNKLAVGIQASVGFGSLAYEFSNLEESGYPTWYDVNYSQTGIGANVSYNTYRFRLELNGNFLNHSYYTSYHNVRFGPVVLPEPGGSLAPFDNVHTIRNLDRHDTKYFEYAATLGVRFHVSQGTDLQPFVTFGQLAALSGEYVGDYRADEEGVYQLPASNFYQAGLRFNFTTGYYQSLFLDLSYQNVLWRPAGYFETYEFESLNINNSVFKFAVGYRFGI